jgi:hypothetical protein
MNRALAFLVSMAMLVFLLPDPALGEAPAVSA